jgi:hypothetical protein
VDIVVVNLRSIAGERQLGFVAAQGAAFCFEGGERRAIGAVGIGVAALFLVEACQGVKSAPLQRQIRMGIRFYCEEDLLCSRIVS